MGEKNPQDIRLLFAYDLAMPRKSHYTITAKDLETVCTACGYPIPPSEIARLDFDHIRCPRCLAVFVPVTKGSVRPL